MYLQKKKHLFFQTAFFHRQLIVNVAIIVSLVFVLLGNIEDIRYVKVHSESGSVFILDRFTNIIIKAK
tara:strand:- start:58 stop:261 length:204 start_codon:yes stop_codon:yes gene_type:complete